MDKGHLPDPGVGGPSLTGPRILILLSSCLSGADVALMTVSISAIGRQVHADQDALQWILSATLLTIGGFLMLGGRLVDLLGIRRTYLLGSTLFAIGLVPGILTGSLLLIIVGRIFAGLGGALLNPATVALIVDQFPAGSPRDKAFGLFSAGQSLGFFGGIMGGGLIVATIGWHGAFVVDFCIPAAGFLFGLRFLPLTSMRASLRELDLPGAATVTIGIGLLVYALSSVGRLGLGAWPVMSGLAGSASFLITFFLIEQRVRKPLLSFSLFQISNMPACVMVALLINALAIATFVPALLYIQQVAHVPPASMGLFFLPALFISFLAARVVPVLLRRFPLRNVVVAGFAFYTVQLIPALAGNGAGVTQALACACALTAICFSAIGSVTGVVAAYAESTGNAPDDKRGVVSALMLATSQIGASIGLAISASTLAAHQPGAPENFRLTSLCVVGGAVLGGLLCAAWFTAKSPHAHFSGHPR